MVRAERGEADLDDVVCSAPGVKRGPAAAVAVGIDQFVHRRIKAGLRQRVDHQVAFPFPIAGRGPVLDRAAAADAEMRAERLDALGAGGLDAQEMTAIRMTGYALDLDGLSRQRVWHVELARRRVGHAIAAVAEAIDGEPLGQWCQASRPASILGTSRPSASNTFLTMPLASSPALAYIAFGESWSMKMSGSTIERIFRALSSAPLSDSVWKTWAAKPPIAPSSIVISTSCSLARRSTISVSSGLAKRASATVVERP